jgi:hypothetical protein
MAMFRRWLMAAQKTRARKALEAEAAALEAEIAALEAPKTIVLVTSYDSSGLAGYPRPPGVKESRRLADGSWETTLYLRVPAFEQARWRREHEAFKAAQWGYSGRDLDAAAVVDAVDVPDVPVSPAVEAPRRPPAAKPTPAPVRRRRDEGALSKLAGAWHDLF